MKFSWPKGLAPGIKKLLSRYQYVLLVLAAGVFLTVSPVWFVLLAALAGIVLKNLEAKRA